MAHRIVVVDDLEEVRGPLADLIDGHGGFTVAGEAGSAEEALQVVDRVEPDLVLADLVLGAGPDGIQLTKGIKARKPLMPVLVLSGRDESSFAERALLAGSAGYLMKDDAPDMLFDAMTVAVAGGIWLSRPMRERLLPSRVIPPASAQLSGSDLVVHAAAIDNFGGAVLAELRKGNRSVVGLSRRLSLSPPAVERTLDRIQVQLGLPSRAALFLFVG